MNLEDLIISKDTKILMNRYNDFLMDRLSLSSEEILSVFVVIIKDKLQLFKATSVTDIEHMSPLRKTDFMLSLINAVIDKYSEIRVIDKVLLLDIYSSWKHEFRKY